MLLQYPRSFLENTEWKGAFRQQGRQLALDDCVGKGREGGGARRSNRGSACTHKTTHRSAPEPLLEWQEGVSHLLDMPGSAGFLE